MLTILLVYKEAKKFEMVKDCLSKSESVKILQAETVDVALQAVQAIHVDLVIVAEQLDTMHGIQFINRLVQVNPLINTALASSLSPDDFHEETEGFGVLMQLPPTPQRTDIDELLQKVEKIAGLMLPLQRKEAKS